jgi:hypothetical protein
MTTDVVFYPHAIQASLYQSTELFTLSLLNDFEPANNFVDLVEFAAGQVGPFFTGSHMAGPDLRFSTPQLTTLFTVTIAGDYYVARNLMDVNQSVGYITDLYYKAGQKGGTRLPDISTATCGCVAIATPCWLSSQSRPARDNWRKPAAAWSSCSATTSTIRWYQLPASALAGLSTGGNLCTLGPLVVNGVSLKGITEWTLDNNIEYEQESSSGDGFFTYAGIKNYRPQLRALSRQTDYQATFGTRGTALTSLTAYLRNKLASGINDPNSAFSHTKIVNAGYGTVKAHRVQSGRVQSEICVDLAQPSPNTPAYSIAVNQQIT